MHSICIHSCTLHLYLLTYAHHYMEILYVYISSSRQFLPPVSRQYADLLPFAKYIKDHACTDSEAAKRSPSNPEHFRQLVSVVRNTLARVPEMKGERKT